MVPRYTALPIIAMFLKVFGWILIAAAVVSSALVLVFGQKTGAELADAAGAAVQSEFLRIHLAAAFWALVNGLVRGLLVLGASEAIQVLLDIEENTRRAAEAATGESIRPTPPRQA